MAKPAPKWSLVPGSRQPALRHAQRAAVGELKCPVDRCGHPILRALGEPAVGFPSYRRDVASKEVIGDATAKFRSRVPGGAVRIVRETGKPIAQVARELGLNEGTLGRWVNLDRRVRDGEGSLSENERVELNRLRKENAELAMERDVLKGSAALWVKEAMRR
jgi:transposase